MHIEVLLIANAAGIENGLLNVQGGGWEFCTPPYFPWTVSGVICGIFAVDAEELGSTSIVSINVTDDGGQVASSSASLVASAVRPPTIGEVPIRVPFVAPMQFAVSGPTTAKVALLDGENELGFVTFAVRDSIPDAPPPE